MPRPRWTGRKWSAIAAGITSPAPGSPAARFTTPPAPIAPVPCPGAAAGPTAAGGRHHARRRSAPPDGHAAAPRSLPPRPDPGGGWARPAQQLRRLRPVQRAGQCRLEPLAAAELAAGQVGTRPVQPQQRQAQPLCVGRRSWIRVLQLRNDRARRVQQRQVLIQIGGRRMPLAMPGAGLEAPASSCSNVDLPLPFGPTRPLRPTKPVARWSIWMFRSENSALPSGSAYATLSSVSDGQSSGSPLHANTRADPTGPAAGRPSSRRRRQWRIGPILNR